MPYKIKYNSFEMLAILEIDFYNFFTYGNMTYNWQNSLE